MSVVWLFVAVGALWGITNPLLNAGSKGMADSAAGDNAAATTAAGGGAATGAAGSRRWYRRLAHDIWYLVTQWRFVVPFALNQCGSAVYVAALARSQLSLAVPACNALTTLFTALTARAIGEHQSLPPRQVLGLALILAGISVCVWSDALHTAITSHVHAPAHTHTHAPGHSDL